MKQQYDFSQGKRWTNPTPPNRRHTAKLASPFASTKNVIDAFSRSPMPPEERRLSNPDQ